MALTAHVFITYPLANIAGATPTSRYSHLWLLPGAISSLANPSAIDPDRRTAIEKVLGSARATTTEDFLKGDPQVVFVDVREEKPYFGGVPFDYLDFFRRDERFAQRWHDYKLAYTVAGFEVWRRPDRAAAP